MSTIVHDSRLRVRTVTLKVGFRLIQSYLVSQGGGGGGGGGWGEERERRGLVAGKHNEQSLNLAGRCSFSPRPHLYYVPSPVKRRETSGKYLVRSLLGLRAIAGGLWQVSPFLIPALISNTASGVVAIAHKARGPNFGVVSACATGTHAIGTAMDFMLRGEVRPVEVMK